MSPRTSHQFGRAPYAIIDSGAIKHLDAGELRVYLAIIAGVGRDSGTTYPSIPTLARRAGCASRTVRRNIKKLEEKGFISIGRGGGRSKANTYTVNTNPDTLNVTLLGGDTRTPRASVFNEEKPHGIEPETLTHGTIKGDILSPKPGHPGCPPNRRTEEQNAMSVCMHTDDRVKSLLSAAGVRGSNFNRLARQPDLTAEQVARTILLAMSRWDGTNLAGLVVRLIDDGERGDAYQPPVGADEKTTQKITELLVLAAQLGEEIPGLREWMIELARRVSTDRRDSLVRRYTPELMITYGEGSVAPIADPAKNPATAHLLRNAMRTPDGPATPKLRMAQ